MLTRFGDDRDWFFEKRFGLFVHWGLYSIPAWHEQAQWRRRIPRHEYEKLATQFNPARYDPDAWLDTFITFWNAPGVWDAFPPHRKDAWRALMPKIYAEVNACCSERKTTEHCRRAR